MLRRSVQRSLKRTLSLRSNLSSTSNGLPTPCMGPAWTQYVLHGIGFGQWNSHSRADNHYCLPLYLRHDASPGDTGQSTPGDRLSRWIRPSSHVQRQGFPPVRFVVRLPANRIPYKLTRTFLNYSRVHLEWNLALGCPCSSKYDLFFVVSGRGWRFYTSSPQICLIGSWRMTSTVVCTSLRDHW